ncbi:Hpt domain-containing protein [Pseudarthrobacter sulfonivorans]|uniref:Hpt domain-containing protein n=1 Tax=Pseudarthrobacter sulfonivorans TaxID=121292 RepID=UPI002866A41F|nr:Hpt domain-containing protein [Pseudarthrobacter sulfonivorans]MDR6416979.1 HPt (histidine-containing phosphotransfer) domain-containing protein [Pseudarthrobacter sulfonivorans]
MTRDDFHAKPLLDPTVVDRLRDELDDSDGVWSAFLHNFIALLPDRTERLRLTLTTGDLAGALDSVLSLKTSSQMVGAERLAELAFDLERSLRSGADAEPERILPKLAVAHLRPILKCEQQTANLLSRYLRDQAGDE